MNHAGNRIFDEFAKLATDAAGVAQGVRHEIETALRSQIECVLGKLDLVQREEFEAVKEMAAKVSEENESLSARLAILETQLAAAKNSE